MRWKMAGMFIFVGLMFGLLASSGNAAAAKTYKIRVNKQQNTVNVYVKKDGEFEPYTAFVCSVGSITPIGSFRIPSRYKWRSLVESTYGQYATRITGHILFHSVWYDRIDPSRLSIKEFNKLGTVASHGCVRLCVRDAKWIYDNCPNGTVVEIYNSKNPGPFGKPKMVKMSGKWGYDPTDIWTKNNPYNKKKPKITGAKNKHINYGTTDYDVFSGVRAKDTLGKNAASLLKATVQFRAYMADKYKKVKKVNTKAAGFYKITYQITDLLGRTVKKTVVHQVIAKGSEQEVTASQLANVETK